MGAWTAATVAAIGAVLLGGSLIASAHGGDTAKVHSCVNKYAGWIRIIPASGTRSVIENPLDWDQVGATGPSGPTGPTGPAGPGGQLNGVREYTASGTFTVPADVTRILIEAIGAGGGGAYRKTLYGGGGGGAGGYVRAVITVTAGAVCTVTVGSGGAPGTSDYDDEDGGAGTASTVDCGAGAATSAGGGAGGHAATGVTAGGGSGVLPPSPLGQGIIRVGGTGSAPVQDAIGPGGVAVRGSLRISAGDGGDGSFNLGFDLGESGQPGWVLIQW